MGDADATQARTPAVNIASVGRRLAFWRRWARWVPWLVMLDAIDLRRHLLGHPESMLNLDDFGTDDHVVVVRPSEAIEL